MNCKELRNNVRDLAGGGLDDRRRAEAQAHMAACEACAADFEAERQLTMALCELAGSHAEERPTGQVEAALQRAFRARSSEQAVRTPVAFPWRWAGVAAAMVIAAAVFYAVAHRAPLQKTNAVNSPARQQPVVVEPQRVAVASTVQKPKPTHRRVGPKADELLQVVTVFYQVPYAEPLRPEESKRIVRVRVPRSTLVQFGFPVDEAQAQEPISADVLVGDDNLARAIRLVGGWRPRAATRGARPVNANFVR